MQVRTYTSHDLDPATIEKWRDLFIRSCHQNPFLAPEFMLPAWRWLTPGRENYLLVVESGAERRWLAAGAFCANQVTQTLPWPHIVTAASHYTFRTGLLVDTDFVADALEALLLDLASRGPLQQTLEIPGLRLDSTLARELSAAAERLKYSWHIIAPRSVPAIFPEIVSDDYIAEHWSASRRKSLRRSKAKLETLGPVSLRLFTDPNEVMPALDTFLQLEHDSWKGEQGTSCISNFSDGRFIREMVDRMAQQNHILISELCAGDEVIASALNLTSGPAMFAFKIGWNRHWAAVSPGIMHEAELVHAARDRLRQFTLFDSCATEESYLATIWPERIPVATGILHPSRWSRWSDQILQTGRRLQRWIGTEE